MLVPYDEEHNQDILFISTADRIERIKRYLDFNKAEQTKNDRRRWSLQMKEVTT